MSSVTVRLRIRLLFKIFFVTFVSFCESFLFLCFLRFFAAIALRC